MAKSKVTKRIEQKLSCDHDCPKCKFCRSVQIDDGTAVGRNVKTKNGFSTFDYIVKHIRWYTTKYGRVAFNCDKTKDQNVVIERVM